MSFTKIYHWPLHKDTYSPQTRKKTDFNNSERARFKNLFIRLGWGRWAEIKERASLNRWSAEDVHRYARAFLHKLAQVMETDESQLLAAVQYEEEGAEVLEKPTVLPTPVAATTPEKPTSPAATSTPVPAAETPSAPAAPANEPAAVAVSATPEAMKPADVAAARSSPIPLDGTPETADGPMPTGPRDFNNDGSLTDPRFLDYLRRGGRHTINRLQLAARIASVVKGLKRPDEIPIIDGSVTGEPPAGWWTNNDDRHLVSFLLIVFSRFLVWEREGFFAKNNK